MKNFNDLYIHFCVVKKASASTLTSNRMHIVSMTMTDEGERSYTYLALLSGFNEDERVGTEFSRNLK